MTGRWREDLHPRAADGQFGHGGVHVTSRTRSGATAAEHRPLPAPRPRGTADAGTVRTSSAGGPVWTGSGLRHSATIGGREYHLKRAGGVWSVFDGHPDEKRKVAAAGTIAEAKAAAEAHAAGPPPGKRPGKPGGKPADDFARWAQIARNQPGIPVPGEPLAVYGNRLHVHDQSPTAHTHLSDLERIPAPWHAEVAHHMAGRTGSGVFVGDRAMPDLDHMQQYRGVQPRGWPAGSTWDTVPGAWAGGWGRLLLGGGGHGHGSTSLAGHEFGHAADDAAGEALSGTPGQPASWLPDYQQLYNRLHATPGLNPYFRQGSGAGHKESWAEGFAAWADGLATGTSGPKITAVFGCDPQLGDDLAAYYAGVQTRLQAKRSPAP